jgi:hypothetical protein
MLFEPEQSAAEGAKAIGNGRPPNETGILDRN